MIGLSDPFTIARVVPGTLAETLGLIPGDRLLAINDVELHDEIDFNGAINDEWLVVRVLGKDGATREVEGGREYGVSFGAEFEARQPKRCHNNCVFCFVYQHPKGVRRELLIKDDDYVFSFVHANFITLTNLSEPDFQRILDERLSPLYVSVHATDPATRVKLMKNPKSGQILQQLDVRSQFSKSLPDRLHRILRVGLTLRSTEVRGTHAVCPTTCEPFDRR